MIYETGQNYRQRARELEAEQSVTAARAELERALQYQFQVAMEVGVEPNRFDVIRLRESEQTLMGNNHDKT